MDWHTLHNDALVIDGHNDTIVAHIRRGNISLSGDAAGGEWRYPGKIDHLRGIEEPRPGANYIQINFPLMRQGGIDAGFFAVDVTIAEGNRLAYAMDGFGYLFNDLEGSGSGAVIVRRTDDLRKAKAAGKPALILAIEHADGVERSLHILRSLYELGVRSIGLTHNISSQAADGNLEARDGVGLTRFGVELVREMNRLGMVVDLAHVSPSAFFGAIDVSSQPVIFSHGNCRALCDHPRNLTDEQLRALQRNGGVIGMSYVPSFIDADPSKRTLERLLDHLDHAVQVAGVETVGLGGDFDGGGTVLADAAAVPQITEGLARRGYSEADIRQMLGLNFLRVVEQAIG